MDPDRTGARIPGPDEGGPGPKTLPESKKTESSWSRLEKVAVKVYVDPGEKRLWERRAAEAARGDPNLSEFIRNTINLHVKGGCREGATGGEAERLRVQLQEAERTLQGLQEEVNQLKRREWGVSERRVLEKLRDGPKNLDQIVQELIDTEAEAAYETLQKLLQRGEVEYVSPHDLYRLKTGPRRR